MRKIDFYVSADGCIMTPFFDLVPDMDSGTIMIVWPEEDGFRSGKFDLNLLGLLDFRRLSRREVEYLEQNFGVDVYDMKEYKQEMLAKAEQIRLDKIGGNL